MWDVAESVQLWRSGVSYVRRAERKRTCYNDLRQYDRKMTITGMF